jgi:mycoredoxin
MTEKPSAPVEIFTKPGCPYCAALKQKLQADGTPFIDHNVHADLRALQRMLQLNGGRRNVPTIVQGDEVIVGYHGM